MIVIFEGPDGVGKTTLKTAIAEQLNDDVSCIDRLFLSDMVYAALRGKAAAVKTKQQELEQLTKAMKPMYILLTATREEIEETLKARKEVVDSDAIVRQLTLFDAFASLSLGHYRGLLRISRSRKSVGQCVREIKEQIKYFAHQREAL